MNNQKKSVCYLIYFFIVHLKIYIRCLILKKKLIFIYVKKLNKVFIIL